MVQPRGFEVARRKAGWGGGGLVLEHIGQLGALVHLQQLVSRANELVINKEHGNCQRDRREGERVCQGQWAESCVRERGRERERRYKEMRYGERLF